MGKKKIMTPDEFEKRMKKIAENGDEEAAHCEADNLMCTLLESMGYGAGVEVFNNMDKWYA